MAALPFLAMRTTALLLALLTVSACTETARLPSPRGDCFEITATPTPRDAYRFKDVPGVLELGTEVLPDLRTPDGPQPFRRARSWPAVWSRDEPLAEDDPVGGWRRAGWRHAAAGWVDDGDAATDSLVIDIGPYAIAFAGLSFVVRRDGGTLRGRVVWFTDVMTEGELPYRQAPVTGRRVACPTARAHLDRRPYRL